MLCLALLLSPGALASSGEGYFVLDGNVNLPADSGVSGPPLGAFLPDARELSTLEVRAERLHVYVAERDYLIVQPPTGPEYRVSTAIRTTEWNLTSASLRLTGEAAMGWFGLYGGEATRLTLTSHEEVTLGPSEASHIGNADAPLLQPDAQQRARGEPTAEYYRATAAEDHFSFAAAGAYAITGGATLKLLGPTFVLTGDERTDEVKTGSTVAPTVPKKETLRWLVVYVEKGTISLTTTAPLEVLLKSVSTSWSGTAEISPVRGHLSTEDASYAADGKRVFLTGDFSATLAPRREADRLLTSMSVSGTLAGTTLTPQIGRAHV